MKFDGEVEELLDRYEGKDVLMIYTFDWSLISATAIKLLESPELSRELCREGLAVIERDATDTDSPAGGELRRRAGDGLGVHVMTMLHRDGMVTHTSYRPETKETLLKTLKGIIAKSEAGKGDPLVDAEMFERADVVVRARADGAGRGSKYHWTNVNLLTVFKAPDGAQIPDSLQVAGYSFADPLPGGEATLYLVPYNPGKPELGWKLLQDSGESGEVRTAGFSHAADADED